jgi:hypothetical protein
LLTVNTATNTLLFLLDPPSRKILSFFLPLLSLTKLTITFFSSSGKSQIDSSSSIATITAPTATATAAAEQQPENQKPTTAENHQKIK